MTYNTLNLKFYDALNQIFNINKHRTWQDLSQEISIDKIVETYKVFGELFPASLNRYDLLPKNDPKQKLTAIFHGALDGQKIINNIARYSLYNDELIVFHPLQNPNITHPDYNPISNPNQWKLEFVNNLYFYIVIQKWVKAGLVHLIENPFYFDAEAKNILIQQAELRVSQYEEELIEFTLLAESSKEIMFEKFKQSFLGMPLNIIQNEIEKSYPKLGKTVISELAAKIKQNEKTLPLYVDFGDAEPSNLLINKSGGNIEMVEAICKLTGAHSYSTDEIIRKQLELRGDNPFWSKFSELYGGINLTYLDSVDTSFALQIRQEERIGGLRSSLRSLSSFLESNEVNEISEEKILDFNDRIKQEVKKSEVEWQKIIDDARKQNATAAFGTTVIGAIIDPTKILVPAIGIPSSVAIIEFFKKRGLKSYRSKDPYSVFVDLKNKKPSFISSLKNCIV